MSLILISITESLTQFLTKNGIYDFWNWFDHSTCYLLYFLININSHVVPLVRLVGVMTLDPGSLFYATLNALAYFYMVCSWGGIWSVLFPVVHCICSTCKLTIYGFHVS